MLFNSYVFIAFFIVMLILHNMPFPWKVKKINLLLASYIFYAAWNPPLAGHFNGNPQKRVGTAR